MLRDFTKEDWYGFAGTERCKDGTPPKITFDLVVVSAGHEYEAIAVADRTAVCIMFGDGPDVYDSFSYVKEIPYVRGVALLEWMLRRHCTVSVTRLYKIGFRRI